MVENPNKHNVRTNVMVKGVIASPGVVLGPVLLIGMEEIKTRRRNIADHGIDDEVSRFELAVEKTKTEVNHVKEIIARRVGEKHAHIFDAHLLMLEDQMLIDETISLIRDNQINAEYALKQVLDKLAKLFLSMDDEYLRERNADVKDIGRRLLKHLTETEEKISLADLKQETIIIIHDLSPSDTAQMVRNKVLGFATDIGGSTSHTAIVARSLEIPAVVGLKDITKQVQTGDELIIDGQQGLVIINPDETTKERYRKIRARLDQIDRELYKLKELPAETRDGHLVELAANIEFPSEVPSALEHGARGIGLYRTEFLYMNRSSLPGE